MPGLRKYDHVLERANQRYPHLRITVHDIVGIEEMILGPDNPACCRLPSRTSPGRDLWAVRFRKTWIPVIFDYDLEGIVTFRDASAIGSYRDFLRGREPLDA